ncbi:PASTA domain-containing protein [Micromonospora nigra]|uniref:PASTA domain-containing protein n=1 Tax=Micromonospora nigra TaxID=145857 RepID=A0A1C6S0Q5_9ACTN|nr:PASTA domain-containing protein [Micromonospora nigra]SCL23031.1 PASTA domain-containing protein [Micromonospora nigra]
MSDDRQQPPAGGDDRTQRIPDPADRTQRIPDPADRAAGDGPAPDRTGPDATAPLHRDGPDRTAPMDRVGPDRTAPMDRVGPDETAALPPERSGPAWSGRAEVPQSRPVDEAPDWYPEDQSGRRWWAPILWGVLVLLLLGLLGVGLWFALRSADDPAPAPSPTGAPTAPPTSAAPTTRAPTTAPASTAPAQVPMPPLEGLSVDAARVILDGLDLDYRIEYRPSDAPEGTVLATDPEAGAEVDADGEVTLIVAEAAPSPSVTSAKPTGEVTASPTPTP